MTYKTFYILLFTFYLLPFSLSSQKVEVLEKGETANLKQQPKIDYLFTEPDDDDRIYFVATLRAVGNEDIAQLFNVIRKEAGKMGANCFRLEEYIPGENISSLTLTTYFALRDYLDENDRLKEYNVIYVFGNDNSGGSISFKLNGKKKVVNNREYLRYENGIGDKVKISKGRIMGASVTITGDEYKPATYLTVSGFGVAPVVSVVVGSFGYGAYGGVAGGVSFSTGKINYMDSNLANLLLLIWKESETSSQ